MTNRPEKDGVLGVQSPFKRIKQIDPDGNEFWSGRDVYKVLSYANWNRASPAYQEVHTSLCLENPGQREMLPIARRVEIGFGAIREVEDWRLSRYALDRVLSRVASHKPEAVRELRRRNESRFRIEIEVGAILFEFCEQAGLSIIPQKQLGNYRFDFCINEKLLIEVDEMRHKHEPEQIRKDKRKNRVAARHGFKLLRIQIPFNNVVKLCGMIVRLLNENPTVDR